MKNQIADPEFKNGSFCVKENLEVSIEGKFEMLQSSIYPDCYQISSEYFFVIKVQFNPTIELDQTLELKKLHLRIWERSRNKETGEFRNVIVQHDKDLKESKDSPVKGITITPGCNRKEFNILLYIENLNANVTGFISYKIKGQDEFKKLHFNQFVLDLPKGQKLIKNFTFKEFWDAVSVIER